MKNLKGINWKYAGIGVLIVVLVISVKQFTVQISEFLKGLFSDPEDQQEEEAQVSAADNVIVSNLRYQSSYYDGLVMKFKEEIIGFWCSDSVIFDLVINHNPDELMLTISKFGTIWDLSRWENHGFWSALATGITDQFHSDIVDYVNGRISNDQLRDRYENY